MMDGRRHSVDIPISRTLIALRRVRSLRDPSTNSMSKFSALLENMNWETNSNNEISLRFASNCQEGSKYGLLGLQNLGLNELNAKAVDDFKFQCDMEKSKSKCENGLDHIDSPIISEKVNELFGRKSNEEIDGKKPMNERCHSHVGLDPTSATASNNCSEGMGSTTEPIAGSPLIGSIGQSMPARWKSNHKNRFRSSGMVGDVLSRVGSPCLSASDAWSSRTPSLFGNDDTDDRRCGISCCWTRTPRSRESNTYSDVEVHPLLSRDVMGRTPNRHGCLRNIGNESPRNLTQKFRPKSFNELVGQNVVARSLLGAIARAKVALLYLFHGPRGTGKTTAARIFAAALNCLSLEEDKPCGLCQECDLFFSGRSKDVKEVDSVRINRAERNRALIRSATSPPISSRFKIFIVDECHLLHEETWVTILNSLENISHHVVFVMITPDLDKIPKSAVTRSQRYNFVKIKDSDIASRLGHICREEGLESDQVALDFIASKSNGSLRDAEMMLDQLSLLGKRITLSMAYDLIGVVSDDELLNLLDLALSSDTSNTVIRARELMKSRIDPMQLVSQLANIIMDILASRCEQDCSEVRRNFQMSHASEADMQRLRNALKVLSEAEKQLRMSKNQITWLTVALLQLSSLESGSFDASDPPSLRNSHERDGDFGSTSSTEDSSKHLSHRSCDIKLNRLVIQGNRKATLESVWMRATELCQSSSLKYFLRKQGKLSSLCVSQGVAVAEVEFHYPDCVTKAEKSWKLIENLLRSSLGCNEVRINLVLSTSGSRYAKLKKISFNLFGCSRRMHHKSQSPMRCGSESDCCDHILEKPMIRDSAALTCSSDFGCQELHNGLQREEMATTFRGGEGNIGINETTQTSGHGVSSSKEEANDFDCETLSRKETEELPPCFPRSLSLRKKLRSSENSQVIYVGGQPEDKLALSVPGDFDTYINSHDCCVFGSNDYTNNSIAEEGSQGDNSMSRCWRNTACPPDKAWPSTQQPRRSPLVGWVLPCATTK